MKKLLMYLLATLSLIGCHDAEDPFRAFKEMEILETEVTVQTNWLQKGQWIFNSEDSICARLWMAPRTFGPCEGTRPALPAYSDFTTSPTGDTVLIWNKTTSLDPYCHVLDLRNAPDVIYLGKFTPNGVYAASAGIHNGYMYATKDADQLAVYDLSMLDPLNPILESDMEKGAVKLDGIPFTQVAAFQDTFAYVGGNGSHIYVLSIADPIRPRVLSDIKVQLSYGLTVYQGHLYNKGNGKIDILSLEDPAHPLPVDRIDDIHPIDIKWQDNYMYVATRDRLIIYDISEPTAPVRVRSIAVSGQFIDRIWLLGQYVVAATTLDAGFFSYNLVYFYPNTP